MKSELIIALDVPTASEIPPIVQALPDEVKYYKVGLELFVSEGPEALRFLKESGKEIFLDLKLHDIPRTVARAVSSACRHGVTLLTLHAGGGRAMLTAAAEAAREAGSDAPALLAITTLTSLDAGDLSELGVQRDLREHTLALGELAISCGIDGLVCSPLEARSFRERIGPEPFLVTPGIRPANADAGDQKRIATPANAVADGASFLVVGRPIVQADDPAAAAVEILSQMRSAEEA
ncbi:MAG: orotidine-5'-phosphate decarboxylase [Kiritimatiellia bacterium]|jgi:orotidine-5'-phosphate decarboxylase|nr:orotidine-5'-phosphate decarboxylase [Kiritimatiellia bacterium]